MTASNAMTTNLFFARCSACTALAPQWLSALDKVALRIGQDHVAHRLVIFHIAGAAAEVAIKRLGDGLLEIGTQHAFLRQPFEQHLSFVEKARGAIAALESKVLDEGFLQNGELAVLGMADLPLKRTAGTMHVGLV